MSEERKDNEGDEIVLLHHSCHEEHPLSLTIAGAKRAGLCYGCNRYVSPRDSVYICSRNQYCSYGVILHEECAEMPGEISLSSHPQHSLVQKENLYYIPKCAVCKKGITRIGYYCSDSSCNFKVHMVCAHDIETFKSNINIEHPSHPLHRLTLQRKSCSFRCDACGTKQRAGSCFVCSNCQYWIHESCAALPTTRDFCHLHHHQLSLAYRVPLDYIIFKFNYCRICYKILLPKYWVYHCRTCRYVVHINCAIHYNPDMVSNIDANAAEGEDMIASFVAKVGGAKGEYKLHNSDHQLHIVSSSSLHDQEEDDDDDEEDRDELLYYGNKSELVCDGCITPILDKKQKKSSHEYISCGDCKYFLHLACSQLPPELPSHPLHNRSGHILTLQSCRKLDSVFCWICRFYTNGLYYGCTECGFTADVKCISLPDTIKHESHPQHLLKLLTEEITGEFDYSGRECDACGDEAYGHVCYRCDICETMFHSSCCLLPAAVNNPAWDKKPLPLTFDAAMNHPSSFYCEVCEEEMNPMLWMYHCRDTDVSVHPKCFPTASGEHRNIKLGQRYRVDAVHSHPLAYQPLTTKKVHCDVCNRRKVYGTLGFQCDSEKCEFVMCLEPCGRKRKDAMHAVDD